MPHDPLIPPAGEILGWIESVCERGVRRPGYPADAGTTAWIAERFGEIGLLDVRLEPVPLPRWEPRSWSLHAGQERIECFPLPHSAPGDVQGRLTRADVAGNVALETVTLSSWPQSFVRDHIAIGHHDPDDDFDSLVQVLPFGPKIQAVMDDAVHAGATGWVGVFDAPWESCRYYVPYDGVARPIPGVWVSKSDGERLDAMLRRGEVSARIVVDSVREQVITHNVVGTLPGSSDEWVIVASHHDGPWASAVEDASGIALVLAQASYWSRVKASERPHNMLFALTSGHMVAGSGTAAFIAAHKDLLPSVALEVHLEHTARECTGVDGRLVPTEDPEVRWWFTTRNDDLVASVREALAAEDLRRSLVMPPDGLGPHPPTDGGYFHVEGVPLVNFLAAPMYLFDAQDTLDKIHEDSLVPVTRAAIRIIESTRNRTAAQMRSSSTA